MAFKNMMFLLITSLFIGIIVVPKVAKSDNKKPVKTNNKCMTLKSTEIPVLNLQGQLPLPLVGETQGFRVTQRYNTKESDPDCYKAGHNGIDVGGEYGGDVVGKEEIKNVFFGTVIVSGYYGGWGESVTVVSRLNKYSEELVTTSFHHLDVRYVSHCEKVNPKTLIGMEGKTGSDDWQAHLHFTVRYWANLDHLYNWLGRENGMYFVFGENGYFGHNGIKFKGSFSPVNSSIDESSPYFMYGHLNPDSLLKDYFLDYNLLQGEKKPDYFWSKPYALKMRSYGFNMGDWNGDFGAGKPALRRDVARWTKIASKRDSRFVSSATFDDVPLKDPDSPYIEAMTKYPSSVPVINPNHTCSDNSHNFCPDRSVNRAEALKMIVLAFYYNKYVQVYNDDIWTIPKNIALQNLMLFKDVSPLDWFASYVYFGALYGLVENQEYFNPAQPVMKEEMAKWIVVAYESQNGAKNDPCLNKFCKDNEYCDSNTGKCVYQPTCIPSETQECEAGGGYIPAECEGNLSPVCSPNQTKTQSCGNGGTQKAVCRSDCVWGAWGECTGEGSCNSGATKQCGNCGTMTCLSNYSWSDCKNEGVCSPGQIETQNCNGTGTQTRTCGNGCSFGSWSTCSVQQVCSPGQTETQQCTSSQGYSGTQSRICNQNGQWGSWGTCQSTCVCSSGVCCDGCNFKQSSQTCDTWNEYRCSGSALGDDAQYRKITKYCSGSSSTCNGSTNQSSWLTLQDCSSTQRCEMNGSTPECKTSQSCVDTYYPNTKTACFDRNANDVEICLTVKKVSGSLYQYQVCKTGVFQNNFTYEIKDILNSSYSPIATGSGSAGISCTPWKNIDFSYVPGYGSNKGATIRADVKSPVNSEVPYRSSLLSLYKECI